MKTAVVILNWNTKGYLEKFVPGILHSLEGTDAELVVADSASTDGSMQMMTEKFPEVRRINLDKNYGFRHWTGTLKSGPARRSFIPGTKGICSSTRGRPEVIWTVSDFRCAGAES